jgi:hypothetical protein
MLEDSDLAGAHEESEERVKVNALVEVYCHVFVGFFVEQALERGVLAGALCALEHHHCELAQEEFKLGHSFCELVMRHYTFTSSQLLP